eukprot:scaffold76450_cov35-Tisochrysis_lutea.AAC.1
MLNIREKAAGVWATIDGFFLETSRSLSLCVRRPPAVRFSRWSLLPSTSPALSLTEILTARMVGETQRREGVFSSPSFAACANIKYPRHSSLSLPSEALLPSRGARTLSRFF